jgi:NAD(P)-dependent dehydrogenase (short-subunit alcohol dehydrogenase family)
MRTTTMTERVAIVTGGSRGIGRACALRLAHDGWCVAVNFASSAAEAHDVVEQHGSPESEASRSTRWRQARPRPNFSSGAGTTSRSMALTDLAGREALER